MPITEERMEAILANAELVVRELAQASGQDFDYGAASVAWVEGFIERQRSEFPENAVGLVGVLGCYLGEAIITAVPGADWSEDENGMLVVLFANGDSAYPFNKVEKQLVEGLQNGESILSFYNVCVDYVAAGKLSDADQEGAP